MSGFGGYGRDHRNEYDPYHGQRGYFPPPAPGAPYVQGYGQSGNLFPPPAPGYYPPTQAYNPPQGQMNLAPPRFDYTRGERTLAYPANTTHQEISSSAYGRHQTSDSGRDHGSQPHADRFVGQGGASTERQGQASSSGKPAIDIDAILKDERLKNVLFSGISKATQKLEQSLKSGTADDSANVNFFKDQGQRPSSQLFPSAGNDGQARPKSILKRKDEGRSDQTLDVSSEKLSVLEKTLQILRGKTSMAAETINPATEKRTNVEMARSSAALGQLSSYSDDVEDEEHHLYGEKEKDGSSSQEKNAPFWSIGAAPSATEAAKRDTTSSFDMKEKLYEEWRNKLNKEPSKSKPDTPSLQAFLHGQQMGKGSRDEQNSNPKDNEELDSTVQNILQSIGFNFDLSKRMQELAKQKKRENEDLQTGIVDQGASFLKNVGDIEKLKANLLSVGAPSIDSLIKKARAETQGSRSSYDRHYERSRSPEHRTREMQRNRSPSPDRRHASPYSSRSPERQRRSWTPDDMLERRRQEGRRERDQYDDRNRSPFDDRRAATPPRGSSRSSQHSGGREESSSTRSRLSERFRDEPKDEYYYPDEQDALEPPPSMPLLKSYSLQKKSEDLSSGLLPSSISKRLSDSRNVENFTVMSRNVEDDGDSFLGSRRIILAGKSDRIVVSRSPSFRDSQSPHQRCLRKRSASPLSPLPAREKRFRDSVDYENPGWEKPGLKITITDKTPRERSYPSPSYDGRGRDLSPSKLRDRRRDATPERREPMYSSRGLSSQGLRQRSTDLEYEDSHHFDRTTERNIRDSEIHGRSPERTDRLAYDRSSSKDFRDKYVHGRSPDRYERETRDQRRYERSPGRELKDRPYDKSPDRGRDRSANEWSHGKSTRDRGGRDRFSDTHGKEKRRLGGEKDRPPIVKCGLNRKTARSPPTSPGRRRSPDRKHSGYKDRKGDSHDSRGSHANKYKLDNRKKYSEDKKQSSLSQGKANVDLSKMSDSERKAHLAKLLAEKGKAAEIPKKSTTFVAPSETSVTDLKVIAGEKSLQPVIEKIDKVDEQNKSDLIQAIERLSTLSAEDRRDVLIKMSSLTVTGRQDALKNLSLRQAKVANLKQLVDKLKKEQNVLMRKSRRSGLGAQNPQLVKNTEEQSRLQSQIDRLCSYDPQNPFEEVPLSPPPSHSNEPKGKTIRLKVEGEVKPKIEAGKIIDKKPNIISVKAEKKEIVPAPSVPVEIELSVKTDLKKQTPAIENWISVSATDTGKLPELGESAKDRTHRDEKEKEKDTSRASGISSGQSKVYYEYIDGGNHFCKYCHVHCNRIDQLFEHLQGKKHLNCIQHEKRPWKEHKSEKPPRRVGRSCTRRIKGSEMLFPVVGFYCSLCKMMLHDSAEGADHLKSDHHYNKYLDYVKINPVYEKKLLLDRAGSASKKKSSPRPPSPPSPSAPAPPLPPPPPTDKGVSSKGKKGPKAKKQLRMAEEGETSSSDDDELQLGKDNTTVEDMDLDDDEDKEEKRAAMSKVPKMASKEARSSLASVTKALGVENMKETKEDKDKPLDQFISIEGKSKVNVVPSTLNLSEIPIPPPPPEPPKLAETSKVYTAKSQKEIDDEEKRMMGIDVDAMEEQPLSAIPVPPPRLPEPSAPLTVTQEPETTEVVKKPKSLDTLFSKAYCRLAASKVPVKAAVKGITPTEIELHIQQQIQEKLQKEKEKLLRKKQKEEEKARKLEEPEPEPVKKRVFSSSSSDDSSDESEEETVNKIIYQEESTVSSSDDAIIPETGVVVASSSQSLELQLSAKDDEKKVTEGVAEIQQKEVNVQEKVSQIDVTVRNIPMPSAPPAIPLRLSQDEDEANMLAVVLADSEEAFENFRSKDETSEVEEVQDETHAQEEFEAGGMIVLSEICEDETDPSPPTEQLGKQTEGLEHSVRSQEKAQEAMKSAEQSTKELNTSANVSQKSVEEIANTLLVENAQGVIGTVFVPDVEVLSQKTQETVATSVWDIDVSEQETQEPIGDFSFPADEKPEHTTQQVIATVSVPDVEMLEQKTEEAIVNVSVQDDEILENNTVEANMASPEQESRGQNTQSVSPAFAPDLDVPGPDYDHKMTDGAIAIASAHSIELSAEMLQEASSPHEEMPQQKTQEADADSVPLDAVPDGNTLEAVSTASVSYPEESAQKTQDISVPCFTLSGPNTEAAGFLVSVPNAKALEGNALVETELTSFTDNELVGQSLEIDSVTIQCANDLISKQKNDVEINSTEGNMILTESSNSDGEALSIKEVCKTSTVSMSHSPTHLLYHEIEPTKPATKLVTLAVSDPSVLGDSKQFAQSDEVHMALAVPHESQSKLPITEETFMPDEDLSPMRVTRRGRGRGKRGAGSRGRGRKPSKQQKLIENEHCDSTEQSINEGLELEQVSDTGARNISARTELNVTNVIEQGDTAEPDQAVSSNEEVQEPAVSEIEEALLQPGVAVKRGRGGRRLVAKKEAGQVRATRSRVKRDETPTEPDNLQFFQSDTGMPIEEPASQTCASDENVCESIAPDVLDTPSSTVAACMQPTYKDSHNCAIARDDEGNDTDSDATITDDVESQVVLKEVMAIPESEARTRQVVDDPPMSGVVSADVEDSFNAVTASEEESLLKEESEVPSSGLGFDLEFDMSTSMEEDLNE